MDLQNTNESLSTQELELLNDFQMEELEERFEIDEAAGKWLDSGPQTPGSVQVTVIKATF